MNGEKQFKFRKLKKTRRTWVCCYILLQTTIQFCSFFLNHPSETNRMNYRLHILPFYLALSQNETGDMDPNLGSMRFQIVKFRRSYALPNAKTPPLVELGTSNAQPLVEFLTYKV